MTPRTSFVLAPTIKVADRVIHEAHIRGTERLTVKQIVEQSSNIGTITIAERLGAGRLASWVDRFGFGKRDRHRLPGRVGGLRPSARRVVGIDDRHRPDRARHRSHAGPDGAGVFGDRERRSARPAASHRSHRRSLRERDARAPRRLARGLGADALDAARRRSRGDRNRGRHSWLHGGRQDGDRGEDRSRRHVLDFALRRVVRRPRSRDEAAARDHGHGRRAARRHLRRRRRRAGVPRDRALQPPAPRNPAGRSANAAPTR